MKSLAIAALGLALTAGLSAQVQSTDSATHRLAVPIGDVAFEVVGQVTNLTATSSNQYGYLTLIRGLNGDHIFTTVDPTLQYETTAHGHILHGCDHGARDCQRSSPDHQSGGTTTIYFDDVPNGTFTDPVSFRDGVPILTLDYRQQVILDTADGTFTVMNLLTVRSVRPFEIGGERVRLGRRGDRFRQFYSGAPPIGTPALNGVFAGYAVTIEPAVRLLP